MLFFFTLLFFFFFNDTATTEIYTLSLHDALPIYVLRLDVERCVLIRRTKIPHGSLGDDELARHRPDLEPVRAPGGLQRATHEVQIAPLGEPHGDRKSTRLNSSHSQISYAAFCLKKKN